MTTSAQIRAALKKRFPHPEFGIVFEVAQGTGWKANRHLDAMAMGVWPSRGLVLHGIEIKISRGDWRRELATPEKAEQLARFCNYFWVAAPENVIPIHELPPNWGLLELKGTKLVQAKVAEKLVAQPHTKDLLAAIFRAACRPAAADEVQALVEAAKCDLQTRLDEDFKRRLEGELSLRGTRDRQDAERWRNLMAEIGEPSWPDDKELVKAVRLIMRAGVLGSYDGLSNLAKSIASAHARIETALGEFSAPVEASS